MVDSATRVLRGMLTIWSKLYQVITIMNYVIENQTVAYLDHYFFQKPQEMPEADASTFRAIAPWFARDCRHVYFLYRVIPGADPDSFVYLGGYNCQWAKDKAVAYYFWPTKAAKQWKILESQSLDAFQILHDCRFSEYAQDNENVFYLGKKLRGADANSFAIMYAEQIEEGTTAPSYHFGKDKTTIYFDGKPLMDVSLARFRVIRTTLEYGTDGVTAFYYDSARTKMVTISYHALPLSVQAHFGLA